MLLARSQNIAKNRRNNVKNVILLRSHRQRGGQLQNPFAFTVKRLIFECNLSLNFRFYRFSLNFYFDFSLANLTTKCISLCKCNKNTSCGQYMSFTCYISACLDEMDDNCHAIREIHVANIEISVLFIHRFLEKKLPCR